jgi:hypothetical protein
VGRDMGSIYPAEVLLACPFCRELFDGNERRTCSVCGVPLVAWKKLAPAGPAFRAPRPGARDGAIASIEDDDELSDPPEYRPLPILYARRGRALLIGLGALGLLAFFLPWVHLTMPDTVDYSGFALSRRLGWTWGAAVAWFVLLPTVFTRRSIVQMRGARVAGAFLSAIPGLTAAILLLRPPHGAHGVPLRFMFGAGLYASLLLSVAGVVVALFFGGRADDIRLDRGSSEGKLVH